MKNFGYLMLWYWVAYFAVTAIGVLHTFFNGKLLHMKGMEYKGQPMKEMESYAQTMPFHPLYNIVLFPTFAWLYLSGLKNLSIFDALITGAVWGTITVLFDLIGWVLVPHPWRCTFKDFYIDYQPWITLIYIVIYCSPLIAYAIIWIMGT